MRCRHGKLMRPRRSRARPDVPVSAGLSTTRRQTRLQLTSVRPTERSSFDAQANSQPVEVRPSQPEGWRRGRLSLLWWVFLADGAVLVVRSSSRADADHDQRPDLDWPARAPAGRPGGDARVESRPAATRVVAVLQPDRADELDRPRPAGAAAVGRGSRSAEGVALAKAFNGMLDRLESARRDAARTALAAQEAERLGWRGSSMTRSGRL